MKKNGLDKGASRVFLRLTWRSIAQASMAVAAALGTALVVLLLSAPGDALAALALILAILAFVIQIMVFISDLFSSAKRDREAYEIYADTRALLSSIEARTTATSDVLNQQMNKMIDRFMVNAKSVVSEEGVDDEGSVGEQMKQDLVAELRRSIAEVRAEAGPEGLSPPRRPSSDATEVQLRRAKIWPSPSIVVQLVEDGLAALTPPAQAALIRLAEDLVWSLENGFRPGVATGDGELKPGLLELADAGFATSSSVSGVFRLTPRGRAAARLVTANGETPDYVQSAIPWLKPRSK